MSHLFAWGVDDMAQHIWVLVHPAVLEDQHEEDGAWMCLWGVRWLKRSVVRGDECGDDAHPLMGHDRDLDNEVRVRPARFLLHAC